MLNKAVLTLFLSFLLCSVTPAQTDPQGATSSWRTFTPEGKGFSVDLPGVPVHRVDKLSKPGIFVTYDVYLLATNSELYVFADGAMPPSERTSEERLESGMSQAVAGILAKGGKEISKRKITSSFGCPGAIWVGSTAGIRRLEVHAFVTPERLYLLMYHSRETGQASDKKAARFFDSFKVTGSPCEEKKPD